MSCLRVILAVLCCTWLWSATGADLVYVPYDEVPGADGDAQVLLPYERFLALWEAANAQRPDVDQAFGAASFGAIDINGELAGDVLQARVSGELRSQGQAWHTILMPSALHLVEQRFTSLAADGAGEVPVFQREDGQLTLAVPPTGAWRWEASVAMPVRRSDDGRSRVDVVLPPAPVIRFSMPLPDDDLVVTAKPAVAASVRDGDDGSKTWQALFSGHDGIELSWEAGREDAVVDAPAVLLVEQRCQATVGARQVRYDTTFLVDVVRGRCDTITVMLPAGSTVSDVTVADLRDWEQQGDSVILRLERPTRERLTVQLGLERVLDDGPVGVEQQVVVGWPRLADARRESGWIALAGDDGLRVRLSAHEDLLQIDPGSLNWQQGAVSAFRFLRPPPASELSLTRLQPTLDTNIDQILRLGSEEDVLLAAVQVDVRQAGVFSIALLVDQRWELIDSEGLGYEDLRDEVGADGQRRLRFTAGRRLLGEQRLQLRFRAPGSIPSDGSSRTIQVPFLSLEGSRRSRGAIALAAPVSWSLHSGERQGVAAAEVAALRRQRGLDRLPRILREKDDYALAFTWISDAPSLAVEARPRQTSLELRQEDRFTLGDGHGAYHGTIACNIRYAGIDHLDITVPAALAGQLKASHHALAEQSFLEPTAGSDERVLRLRFQTPLLGDQRITLEGTITVPTLVPGEPQSLRLVTPRVTTAERSRHLLAIQRSGHLELTATSTMDPVSPADLPASLRHDGVVAGFAGDRPEAVTVDLIRHDLLDLVDASVLLARYSATVTHEAQLRVRANLLLHHRGRPYLALQLPAGARLLELAVDGRSGQHSSRNDDDALLVRLGGRNGLQTIAYIYEQRLADDELGSFGSLHFALPTIASDGENQRVPVEESQLELYLPEDLQAFAFAGSMRPVRDRYGHLQGSLANIYSDEAVNRKLREPVASGLTMRFEPRGQRLAFRRFGDGGDLAFSWLSTGASQVFLVLGLVLVAAGCWAGRRQPRRLWLALAAVVLLRLLLPPTWTAILDPAIALAAALLLIHLVVLGLRAWHGRRHVPAAELPLTTGEEDDWETIAERAGLGADQGPDPQADAPTEVDIDEVADGADQDADDEEPKP